MTTTVTMSQKIYIDPQGGKHGILANQDHLIKGDWVGWQNPSGSVLNGYTSFIIPDGSTYRCEGNVNLVFWAELR